MKKVNRYAEGGEIDPLEAANASSESQTLANEDKGESMLKAMRDEAAKPKTVTKEELAKSGMSLRDYLNKQQGLTRRGGDYSKPVSIVREAPKNAKEAIAREAIDAIKASGRKYPDMSALQAPAKREGMTAMEPRKMAKGGMTASKRADGIAQRGKTRGKMIMCGGGRT